MTQKKGSARVSDDPEELAHIPLQAILLADSFATKFRPITLERPKVLLPLVNTPMIDYTLAWLESAGIEEVFVFCCSHSKQIISYLESSQWLSTPKFSVKTIESHDSVSAGDALRLIYERNVIRGDFVLISGDTVSNMSLTQALLEHKERRKRDSNAVMTMIIKKSKPSSLTHQTRLGNDELFMAIDPDTKQLLFYEDKADSRKGFFTLDKTLLADNPALSLHNDKQVRVTVCAKVVGEASSPWVDMQIFDLVLADCYIDICTPEVLSLFTDNFDYQHLRRHFVKGLLLDDIMGYKIYTHEIHASYAARVDNFRSYETISKDILQRWTYPLVPDVQFSGNRSTKLERQGIYKASDIVLSRSAQIGPFTLVGSGTTVGGHSKITNSVVGDGCNIGSNVSIEGSYIWNNVTIQDGCKLRHAIVCDGVVIKSGAVLEPGVILTFKVIVGEQFVVPAYSKVSLLLQPIKQDSDEELEYADNSSVKNQCTTTVLDIPNGELTSMPSESSEVGVSGVGYIWSVCEGAHEEEWRHSIAPIPVDKIIELRNSIEADHDLLTQNGSLLPPSGELKPDSDIANSEDADIEDIRDDSVDFEKEVEATFLRAVHEGVEEDHVIIEINSLRLSYNAQFADCAGAIFYSVMQLATEVPYVTNSELYKTVANLISKWGGLLKHYLQTIDEEIEVILKFEDMCLESNKEFAPLFTQILHLLYDKDILSEDCILSWESEKLGADEADKIFLKQAETFLQWLKEAPEEDD